MALPVVVGLLLILIGWLLFTGLRARAELNDARRDVGHAKTALLHGETDAAKREIAAAQDHARAARHRTGGVVWRAVAAVPVVGDGAQTVRGLTSAADQLANVTVPTALKADKALDPASIRRSADQFDLAALASAQQPLAEAGASADHVRTDLRRLPSVGYFGPIAHARKELLRDTDDLVHLLTTAHTAAAVVPPMLGADGTRRYFLGFQANAEARGTGGLAGAYAIIRADHGRVTVEHVGSDQELPNRVPIPVDLGREYDDVYGQFGTNQFWGNTNISPDFPSVMKIWLAFYMHAHPDVQLDGAFATDPVALSYVLNALGPVRLPDGQQVTADNVVRLLEVDSYSLLTAERKDFQVVVARAVLSEVLTRSSNARTLLSAFTRAANEQRVLVGSVHAEEALIAPTAVGGALRTHTGPSAYLVVNNDAGNKLDYYLRRSLSYTAGSCSGETRKSTIRITLTNTAPATGLSRIQTQRNDLPRGATYVPGTSRSLIFLYATRGAHYTGGTIDGKTLLLSQQDSYDHRLYRTLLDLAPGQTSELVINLDEPIVAGPAYAPAQPLATPMTIRAKVPPCHRSVA